MGKKRFYDEDDSGTTKGKKKIYCEDCGRRINHGRICNDCNVSEVAECGDCFDEEYDL